ncbi:ATP-dependent DNA helicase PcrA [bioreactor metagenome]|uniref:DNA 3'-5' helicase n=1 Tax=bioreactor metagenome TaxID=1076179 RepID=A0A644VRR9_9ZZZZ
MKRDFSTIVEGLNCAQKQAVEQFEGPSLIIAGAGSGKTRVLTSRIANILNHGHKASSVLALTFTNKASKEMKERIAGMVGDGLARYLWMGTFHSVFIRFLREDAELLGFPKSFTIYDTSDSRSAIRVCVKELGLDEKMYKPNEVLSRISMAKNNLITAKAYLANGELMQRDAIARKPKIGEVYALYERKCRQAGAMDFDDILLYTNIMIRDFPQVLEKLQQRFSFILVDEYQDTNFSQYLIVKKLSANHRNLCVVGDDSQSIYAFRGARIENILNFRKDYPEAKEFKLEQNYRSTQTIVNAANSLIAKNSNRLNKECFSEGEAGEKIEVIRGYSDQEEAFTVVSSLMNRIYSDRAEYSDFAILYRTNAQSRVVEEALRKRSVPYRIYGGHSFYERQEVKDVLAYMRLLVNPKDDEAFRRVVNVPARGIGDTTMGYLAAAAGAASLSMWEAFHAGDLDAFGIKPAAAARLSIFTALIAEVGSKASTTTAYDITMEILMRSGYMEHLRADSSLEGQARLENVEELFNSIKEMEGELSGGEISDGDLIADEDPGLMPDRESGPLLLEEFLEKISLMSAVDEGADSKEENNKVSLMTVHSAKGLEFPYVYVIGMEDNLFPSINGVSSDQEIEEERRLFYVALTRAKRAITLSYAQSRFRWGQQVNYPPSRFLKEVDRKFLNWPYEDGVMSIFRTDSSNSSGLFSSGTGRGVGAAGRSERPARSAQPSAGEAFRRPASPAAGGPSATAPPPPRRENFFPDPVEKLRVGMNVEHERFGYGKIILLEGDVLNMRAVVAFNDGGQKTLLLKFAKLRIVE